MIFAAFLAGSSALLGGVLALAAARQRWLLERTRTFAFAAAASVVFLHLLPELLPALGFSAMLWITAGFALPWLLEHAARVLGPAVLEARGLSGPRVAAEVGLAALLFHSLIEGLALRAALQAPEGRAELEIALVAHHAPLTAAVALPFLELLGQRATLRRVLAVAAFGVGGVLLSSLVPGLQTDAAVLEKATAVTAGALLHVVADEVSAQQFGSRWERAGDFVACAAGLAVAGFGALLHLRVTPAAAPLPEFGRALAFLVLRSAPALLAGAMLFAAWPRSFRLRLDAALLTFALLGPLPALVLLALGAAVPRPPAAAGGGTTFLRLLCEVRQRAPRALAIFAVAAAVEAMVPDAPPAAPLLALLLLASRLEETAAAALAAVLIHRGVPAGVALAALAAGPLLRGAELLRAPLRWSAAVALCAAAALFLDRLPLLAAVRPQAEAALLRPPLVAVALCAAAVLAALTIATLWSAGARGWFAPLRHPRQ